MEDYILLKVVVEKVIDSFPETIGKIARLKFFEGYDNMSISNELNLTNTSVSYYLTKIRKAINIELHKD